MDTGKIFDRVLWGLMVAAAATVATQIQSATLSINSLNEKVAVMVSEMKTANKSLEDHEGRIRALEDKLRGARLRY
jgi:septal ring factor EnvC (AmiA/AmiB activator)